MNYTLAPVAPVAIVLTLLACGPQTHNDESADSTVAGTGSTDAATTSGDGTTTSTTTSTTDPTTTGLTTDSTTPTTGTPVCTAPPLTDEQVTKLAFGVFGDEFAAMPGDDLTLKLGLRECCTTIEPLDACVEYTLTPADGATYDVDSGTLSIDASVPANTIYTLTADVEDGRAVVPATITVYTKESNPLVGVYHEIAQLPCGGGGEIPPVPTLNELWFHANGEFSVTWQPFETYIDYWGTYAHDVDTGTLVLKVDSGNYVPPDVDGEGTFEFEGDQLVLHDIWLGAAQDFMGTPACGHRFE